MQCDCGSFCGIGAGHAGYNDAGSGSWRLLSEGLDPGPHLDFERPGAARLAQYFDISLGNRVGIERAVGPVGRVRAAGAAHAAVDHEMRDVDALRPEFARRALS